MPPCALATDKWIEREILVANEDHRRTHIHLCIDEGKAQPTSHIIKVGSFGFLVDTPRVGGGLQPRVTIQHTVYRRKKTRYVAYLYPKAYVVR